MPPVNVLVVEDDANTGMLLSDILRYADYQVAWARDGMQAMQLIKQFPPALIVLDFLFPAGGGEAFVKRVRMSMQTASVPIVILSAVHQEQVAASIEPGINTYYLPKPFQNNVLLGLLAAILSGNADPASRLHQVSAPPPAPPPKPPRGSVLLIAGNGEERALIRATPVKKGFRVAEAGDGAAALSALGLEGGSLCPDTARPNLIVLDAEVDSGAAHLINARLAHDPFTHSIPVVVITGAPEQRAAFAGSANVAIYLKKPLDAQRLLGHIEELVPVRG